MSPFHLQNTKESDDLSKSPKTSSRAKSTGVIVALALTVSGFSAANNIDVAHADDNTTQPSEQTCNVGVPGSSPGYLWPTLNAYDVAVQAAVAPGDGSAIYFAGSTEYANEPNQLIAVDPETQEVIKQANIGDFNGEVSLALSPDESSIYIVTETVYGGLFFALWDIDTWQMTASTKIGSVGNPNLSILPDGKALAIADSDGMLIDPAVDPISVQPLGIQGIQTHHRDVSLSPNGEILALLENTDTEIDFYDTATWEKQGDLQVPSTSGQINHIAWASDSTLLATVPGSIELIDPNQPSIKGSVVSTHPAYTYNTVTRLEDSRWIATLGSGSSAATLELFTLNEDETGGEFSDLPLPLNGGETGAGPVGNASVVVLDDLLFVGGNWKNDKELHQVAWLPRVNVVQPTTVTVPANADKATLATCYTSLRYDLDGAFKLTWEGSADGGATWSTILDPAKPSTLGFYTANVSLPQYDGYLFRVNWSSQFWMEQVQFSADSEYAAIEYDPATLYDPSASISGEAATGQEVSAVPDGFPTDSTYSYQWFLGTDKDTVLTPIDDANGSSLTLTNDMVDHYLTVTIIGSSDSAGTNFEATAEPIGPISAPQVEQLISAAPTALSATTKMVQGQGVSGSQITVTPSAATRGASDPLCTAVVETDNKWSCELDPSQAIGTKLGVTQTEENKSPSPAVGVVVQAESAGGSELPPTDGNGNGEGNQGHSGESELAVTGALGVLTALFAALALGATGYFTLVRGKRQS